MRNKQIIAMWGAALLAFSLALSGCAPVFSELQSARTVGEGEWELTPGYTSVSYTGESNEGGKETEHVQNHLGFQLAYGLTDNFDLRLRYEYLSVDDGGTKANIIGIGPKYEFVENWLAAYVPVGLAFGGDIEKPGDYFEVHPTLLFTAPFNKYLELNASTKYILTFHQDRSDFLAFNVGLGLSTDRSKYVLRPEYGLAYDLQEEGHYGQFSVGVTFYMSELLK